MEQALPHGSTSFEASSMASNQVQEAGDSRREQKLATSDNDYIGFNAAISSDRVLTKLKELNDMSPEKINGDSLVNALHTFLK